MRETIHHWLVFLRINQVLELIPVSKSTWWAGVKSGKYPKQVKLSKNITAWRFIDIKKYIDGVDAGSTDDQKIDTDNDDNWPSDELSSTAQNNWYKSACADLTDSPMSFFRVRKKD